MSDISFPSNFPTIENMMTILRKTFEKSWRVDLNSEDVIAWLDNFIGKFFSKETEKRLALWLLCNFTYYNDEEIKHLCKILYRNLLHKLILDNTLHTPDEVYKIVDDSLFTSIGNASESGGLLLYYFRQEARLSIDRFIFPTAITPTNGDAIVCIDDVIMSGGTASRFFHKNKAGFAGKNIYYLTLLTNQQAIDKLSALNISTIYCAKLDDRDKAFSEESLCYFKFPQLKDASRLMSEGYGKLIEPTAPLGYKDGQYCFGFPYNIPNNSLPIFWSSNNWCPIFCRKEKYQNAKQVKREKQFFI